MNKIFVYLLLVVLLTAGNSLAQEVFQGRSITVDSATHKALTKWYKSYEIAELDLDRLNQKMIKEKGNAKIELRIGDKNWQLNLYKNELRSSNYKSSLTAGNVKTSEEKRSGITYAGYANGNRDNYVRLAISNDIFRGYIVVDNKFYYFNQLSRIIKKSNKNIIVLYQAKDLKENNSLFCGVTSEQEQAFLSQVESSALALQSGTSSCRILELATDADFEWFQLYGNNANNEILAIINMIQGTYQNNFNLEIVVVFQNVFTTASDPYTGNPLTEAGGLALVTELRTYWESNFTNVERDLVHLFTGKKSNFYGLTGRVYAIGTVCIARDESYGFSRDWADQFETTAHEIGHHFGGVHTQGQDCGTPDGSVMCSTNNHPSLYFSTSSTNTIENFMNTNSTCLLEFDNIEIAGNNTVCNNQTKTYSVNTVLNGSVTWSVNNSKLIILSGQGTSTVTVRGNPFASGTVTLSASIPVNNCDVVVTKSIWVGKPSSFTTNPSGVPAIEARLGSWIVIRVNSTPGASISSLNWWTNNSSALDLNIGSGNCSVECLQTGYNYVYVTSSNVCGTSPFQQIPINVISSSGNCGVYPNPPCFPMSVYPNPSDDYLMISLDETEDPKQTYNIRITDDNGRLKLKISNHNISQPINVSRLQSGKYHLHIESNGVQRSKQLWIK